MVERQHETTSDALGPQLEPDFVSASDRRPARCGANVASAQEEELSAKVVCLNDLPPQPLVWLWGVGLEGARW